MARDRTGDGFAIALALVAVVMRVQNLIDLADTEVAQMIEDLAGAEIDQHAVGAVADDIHVAGILEQKQIVADLAGSRLGSEAAVVIAGWMSVGGGRRAGREGSRRSEARRLKESPPGGLAHGAIVHFPLRQ